MERIQTQIINASDTTSLQKNRTMTTLVDNFCNAFVKLPKKSYCDTKSHNQQRSRLELVHQVLLSLFKIRKDEITEGDDLAWCISDFVKFYGRKYKVGLKDALISYKERHTLDEDGDVVVPLDVHSLSSTKLHSIHEMTRKNVNVVRNYQKRSGVERNERMSSYGKS